MAAPLQKCMLSLIGGEIMQNDDVVLKMSGITKAFQGIKALDKVELSINRGEIHALIGENGAGKSTLMNILIGLIHQDEGNIEFKKKKVHFKSPADALNNGISMVHQEITLVSEMNVAENIWMGRENRFRGPYGVDWKKCCQETEDLLNKLEIHIDPREKIKNLTVASTQLVELARAVSYNSQIIIMDEPTSSLAEKEIKLLFSIVRNLSKKGCAVVFISHKIDEILSICERVTVLRDGKTISTEFCKDLGQDRLIKMIVGRDLGSMYTKSDNVKNKVVMEVRNFSSPGLFEDVSFKLKKGEILGFSGLMGAGRTEIMNAVFGLDKYASGELIVRGKPIKISNPWDAIDYGIGMVTEDRLRTGIVQTLTVLENATLASLGKVANKIGVFNRRDELKKFLNTSELMSVKYSSTGELIGNLSGGNQQKVLISRWLMRDINILILDEPTRGIDIGAKAEIYKLMDKLTEQGISIILISSELPEVLAMSDRILVVRNGRIVFECSRDEATQELLMSNAFGVSK